MDKRPIFLTGFMGCGKSTVGRRLAELLGWRFVDLDDRIVARAGRSIPEIFADAGESEFRQLESQSLAEVAAEPETVVALGGGAFISPDNRAVIAHAGRSVFLNCPLPVLLNRVSSDPNRPLSRTPEQLQALYESRLPAYQQADVEIYTGDDSPDEIVQQIRHSIGI